MCSAQKVNLYGCLDNNIIRLNYVSFSDNCKNIILDHHRTKSNVEYEL